MDLNKIDTIVLSGGGIKGVCYIGFFKSLFQYIDIKQIKHFVGTSVGAMFSLCLTLNYSLDEITKILFKYDFNKVIPEMNLDELLLNYGLSDGSDMRNLMLELLEYKLGDNNLNITFLELYERTNIKLTMTVTNFTTQEIEYWNHEQTPNNLVIDGIMATTRVPLFFTPLHVNNNYYLDGGIINNYPIEIISIDKIDSFIGVCLTSKKDIEEIKKLFDNNNKYDKIIMYIIDILMLTYDSKLITIDKKYMDRTLRLQSTFANFLDVNISDECKNIMIDNAYNATQLFISKFIIQKPDINVINVINIINVTDDIAS